MSAIKCGVCGRPWHRGKEHCIVAQQRHINDLRSQLDEAVRLLHEVWNWDDGPDPWPEVHAFLAALNKEGQ